MKGKEQIRILFMFLITTADQTFWKTDSEILFLGEWCKIYNQKHIWSHLRYQVLPYHWNDRKKLYQDYIYLNQINEKYLSLLSEKLNHLHQVNYSLRYWRIVVGWWLYPFIELLYDRFLSIKTASESGLVSGTWICSKNSGCWTPNECSTFIQLGTSSDCYNQYIYSRIIEMMGDLPYRYKDDEQPHQIPPITTDIEPDKDQKSTNTVISILNKYSPSRWNEIVFVCPYLDTYDSIKLQLSLCQIPFFNDEENIEDSGPVDFSLRRSLTINDNEVQGFEKILGLLIADQIPKAYVEGYARLHKKALDTFPKRPKIIFTANAYHGNTLFQFWSAYNVEQGTKLVGTQHGGHYGTGLWSASEAYQIQICDRYYTWGWNNKDDPKTIPFATGKFNNVVKRIIPDQKGQLLMACASLPRYTYWMYSAPVGPQMLDYLNDQYRFVQSISHEIQENLLLRLYPLDFGWNETERWKEKLPSINQYKGTDTFYQQLNQCRLFIGTYNSTTYLETFAVNYPTILFWDPRYWELRPSAQPLFDKLRKVGILHDTPESAAEMVNEIYMDPLSWWSQEGIQKTLKEFNHNFLRTSDNWLTEWKQEFQNILKETQK